MKQCTRCKEEKEFKLFHSRGKSKKTGLPLYNSWCKKCVLEDNKQRRNGEIIKKSPYKKITVKNRDRYKGTIDPKYLVRGNIANANISSSITNGSF